MSALVGRKVELVVVDVAGALPRARRGACAARGFPVMRPATCRISESGSDAANG